MAKFNPEMNEILTDQMEKHTEGELTLLEELAKLPDEFLVYFQPHINFAHPDIIILHEKGGALIIEVKDWNLSSYTYTPGSSPKDFGNLMVKGASASLMTPFEQVDHYKKEFFEIHCPELLEERIHLDIQGKKGTNVYGVIKTAVYFHNATDTDVLRLFGNDDIEDTDGFKKYKKYTTYWCREDLPDICAQIRGLMRTHSYYNETLHNALCAFLKLSDAWREQTGTFDLSNLDPQQKMLAQCTPGQWSRIKGAAGSGKTLVLAQKAINCYEQKKKPVLILTYNITLRNYIRDRIAQNTRSMSQSTRVQAFEILHYDEFLPQICMRLKLKVPTPFEFKGDDGIIRWEEYHQALADILVSNQQWIVENDCQYETILIDEAQDYESKWFSLIEQLFLARNAEFMVVADEKQNLYGRPLEDKLPRVPGFRGPWRKLNSCYRLSQTVYDLASSFQKEFMTGKYDLDLNAHACLTTEKGSYRFHSVPDSQMDKMAAVWEIVNAFRQEGSFTSPNDICILLNNIASIRALEKTIETGSSGMKVLTMCETEDEFRLIHEQNWSTRDDWNKQLAILRNARKRRFNMNSGTVKLCTVYSFKGWEISTVVLVLDNSKNINDELAYTAITRAKRDVIVISFGNDRYDAFFSSFACNHDASNTAEQRKEASVTMRQSFDSTWDYELSDDPTEYVHSSRYGFGHVDAAGDNGAIHVTYADGRTMDTDYNYFHHKGVLHYIRLIPKESLPEERLS